MAPHRWRNVYPRNELGLGGNSSLLATTAFGQTYIASTFAGVWLPENLPGVSVSLNQIGGVGGGLRTAGDRFQRVIFDHDRKLCYGYSFRMLSASRDFVKIEVDPFRPTVSELIDFVPGGVGEYRYAGGPSTISEAHCREVEER